MVPLVMSILTLMAAPCGRCCASDDTLLLSPKLGETTFFFHEFGDGRMISRAPPEGAIGFEDLVKLVSDSRNAGGYGDSLLVFLVGHRPVLRIVRELVLVLDET